MSDPIPPDPPTVALDVRTNDDLRTRAMLSIAVHHLSPHTRAAYRRDLDAWLAFCNERGVEPWPGDDVAVAAWRDWRLQQGAAPASVRRGLESLAGTWRDLGLKEGNPFRRVKWPLPASRPRPAVTADAVARMLAACGTEPAGLRDAALLALLWSTGVRVGSAASADAKDWKELPGGEAEISMAWKGGDRRTVLIPPEAAARVRVWLSWRRSRGLTDGPLLGLTGKAASLRVKALARAAGLDVAGIMAHGFRAAFITRAFDANVNESEIQSAAGHARLETTRSYYRGRAGAKAVRIVGALPKPDGGT